MRGPHFPLPAVDELDKKIKPFTWNNIPLPVAEAFEEIMKVFKEFKTLVFDNFNLIVETQRVVNMNQKQARTDTNQSRNETIDNLLLADERRTIILAE